MHSCQITSLARFQSTLRVDVLEVEIQSEGSTGLRHFRLSFQLDHAFWIPQYTLDLYPDGEATLALDADIVSPQRPASQLVQIYNSLVHFGGFDEYRQQLPPHELDNSSTTREQPLLHFRLPCQLPAEPQPLEIFRLRSPASAISTVFEAMLLHDRNPRSLPDGWIKVHLVQEAKLFTVPVKSEEVIGIISEYYSTEGPTNPNTPMTFHGDRERHTLMDAILHTVDEIEVAKALEELSGRLRGDGYEALPEVEME